jgi:hypothetical protein
MTYGIVTVRAPNFTKSASNKAKIKFTMSFHDGSKFYGGTADA